MTDKEYYKAFRDLGYSPTGEGTNLTELWMNADGQVISFTRPGELSPRDRAAVVDYIKRTLGIGFPTSARVH